MRVPVAQIPGTITLGGEYDSPLPPSDAIRGAMNDPVAAFLLSDAPGGLGSLLLDDAIDLMRSVFARGATQVGVPSVMMPAFEGVLAAALEKDWTALATGAVTSAIDAALSLLGAIPIVGWLAQGAVSVVRGMIMVAKQKDPPDMVPLAVYNRETNNWYASRALDVVGDAGSILTDWTPLFDVPGTGEWVGIQGDPRGYVFHLQGFDGGAQNQTVQNLGAGKALAPGTGLGLVQVNVDFPESIDINKLKIPQAAYFVGSRTYDKTETLPSYLRVGVGTWQALQGRTAALFQVNVAGLNDRWRKYVEGGIAVAEAFERSGAKNPDVRGRRRNAGYMARTAFYDVDIMQRYGFPLFLDDGVTPDPSNNWWKHSGIKDRVDLPSSRRIDKLVSEKLVALYKRQVAALDTVMVAYCSEKQPAFRAPSMHRRLMQRRRELLRNPAVKSVDLDDVIDEDYRSELYTAKFSGAFGLTSRPGHVIMRPFGPLDAIPAGTPWGIIGEHAKGAAATLGKVALLSGLAYGGYRLVKWAANR